MKWFGIFCISLLAYNALSQQSTQTLFDEAYAALDHNQYERAIALFTRALQEKPAEYDGYFYRALAKVNQQDKEGALTDYSIFLEFNPEHAEALLQRGQLHYEAGHYQLALDDFKKFLKNPKGETSSVFFRLPKYGKGVDKIFTSQNDQRDHILNHIGLCFMKLDDHKQAIHYFDSAIALNANNPDYYIHRGLAFQSLEKNSDAKASYEKALAIDSSNGLALYNLGALSKSQSNDSLSEEYLKKAIESSPNLPYAFAERGYYRLENQNFRGAVEDFTQAITRDPDDVDLWINRGISHEKLGDYKNALSDMNHAQRLKPEYSKAYLNKGNIYMKLQKYELAKEAYDLAIVYDQASGLAFYNRAIALHTLKKKATACNDLKKAMTLGIVVPMKMMQAICDSAD